MRERMRRGTHFRGWGFGDLIAMAGGGGNLWGGGTRWRRLVLVEELPKARQSKPHHTAGVA
jgi:hypothetical protein